MGLVIERLRDVSEILIRFEVQACVVYLYKYNDFHINYAHVHLSIFVNAILFSIFMSFAFIILCLLVWGTYMIIMFFPHRDMSHTQYTYNAILKQNKIFISLCHEKNPIL